MLADILAAFSDPQRQLTELIMEQKEEEEAAVAEEEEYPGMADLH